MTSTEFQNFGGHALLNRHWAYSLLTRMNFVKMKDTTAKSKYTGTNKSIFTEVVTTGTPQIQLALTHVNLY